MQLQRQRVVQARLLDLGVVDKRGHGDGGLVVLSCQIAEELTLPYFVSPSRSPVGV